MATLVLATGCFGLALAPAEATDADLRPGDPASGYAGPELPAEPWTLHVRPGASTAGVDGTEVHPFPTMEWALAIATGLRQQGNAVRVVLAPGVYRETLAVGNAGQDPPPLVVESAAPGAVFVTGADVETRWTPVEGAPALVQAPWEQDWGLAAVPQSWASSNVGVSDGVRRRENVFIDGTPLAQVQRLEDVSPGAFWVDEAGDRIVMRPPTDVSDVDRHLVEVAQRPFAMRISGGAANVTVRGIVFEGAAAPFERHMAYVTDSRNVRIEDNVFRHSSWGGLGFGTVEHATVRGNHTTDNGGNGLDTYKTTDVVIEGNVITGNNVRGARNGYFGWSVAGSKNLLLSQAVFRGNVYSGNLARALWLDTDVRDVLIDGDLACHNHRDALYVEAVQGPVTIQDTTYCENGGAGIAVGTSGNLTVRGSTIADNVRGQLLLTGDRQRSWLDRVLGSLVTLGDFEDITLIDNELTSTGAAPIVTSPVMTIDEFRTQLRAGEIRASGNTWSRPDLASSIQISSKIFPLAEWDALTGDTASPTTTTTTTAPTTTTTVAPTTTTTAPTSTTTVHPSQQRGNGQDKPNPGKGKNRP